MSGRVSGVAAPGRPRPGSRASSTLQRTSLPLIAAGRLRLAMLLGLGLALLAPWRAAAHARFLRSEPGPGAVVSATPTRIDIWFTQELFRRESENRIEVLGPDGASVPSGPPAIEDDDRTHLSIELRAELVPGRYQVRWRTLSAEDGDSAEGEFGFVFDPAATVTSTPMSAVSPSPAAATTTPTAGAPPTRLAPATPDQTAGCPGGLALGMVGLAWSRIRKRTRCAGR